MPRNRLEYVTFRIPPAEITAINELIRERKYLSRSDFLRKAVTRQLEYEEWRQAKQAFPLFYQKTMEEISKKVLLQSLKNDPDVIELVEDLMNQRR